MRTLATLASLAALALLGGCAAPAGPSFGPSTDSHETLSQSTPPFKLVGETTPQGNTTTLVVTASPPANAAFRIETGCSDPWDEALVDAQGRAWQFEEPVAQCAAFGLRDWTQPEVFSSGWDGSVWDGSQYVAAPEGTYTWTISFTAYQGETAIVASLPFTVEWHP